MRLKYISIALIILILLTLIGCKNKVSTSNSNPQTVVENHFKYKNEKNKDKLLTTLTEVYNTPNMVWGFENLESIKLIEINEDTSENIRNGYLFNGRGSVNGVSPENLKVYKVKYELKLKQDGIGPQDSGTYDWWYFVIRKDKNSPWLIDDYGV